jgi:hypothetical protein
MIQRKTPRSFLRANGFKVKFVGGNVKAWVARICGEDVYVGAGGTEHIASSDFKEGLVSLATDSRDPIEVKSLAQLKRKVVALQKACRVRS